MYQLHCDGTTHLYDTRDEAIDALCAKTDAHIGEFTVTPDRLTALTVDNDAWSDWPDDGKRDVVDDLVRDHLPQTEIAEEIVKAEMEMRYHEDHPPDDAVPWDNDDFVYDVRTWFDTHFNQGAFEALGDGDIINEMIEVVYDRVREEMSGIWDEYPHSLDDISALAEDEAETLYEAGYTTPLDVEDAPTDKLVELLDDEDTVVDMMDEFGNNESSDSGLAELFG